MSELAAQVDAWLEPLGDSATGEDLEYDNEFLELNKASEGKPETQFASAEPPDWTSVTDLSESLFSRTRDIRLALLWGRAQLHAVGLSSLPQTLRLVRELFERYWDDVHPKPDPDDGDAYARLNVLAQLEDSATVLADVRQSVVFKSRAVGVLTVRDIEVALERLPPRDDENPMSVSGIEQMLTDAIAEDESLKDLPTQLGDELDALLNLLQERVGYGRAPSCDSLKEMIGAVRKVMPSGDGASDDLDALLGEFGGGDDDSGGDTPAPRRGRSGGGGLGSSIDSREDAVKAIDLVCQYLERTEPSNPAQLLLRRAERLIDKNFLELVKELAPDALNEIAKIMGVDPSSVEGGVGGGGGDFGEF